MVERQHPGRIIEVRSRFFRKRTTAFPKTSQLPYLLILKKLQLYQLLKKTTYLD